MELIYTLGCNSTSDDYTFSLIFGNDIRERIALGIVSEVS